MLEDPIAKVKEDSGPCFGTHTPSGLRLYLRKNALRAEKVMGSPKARGFGDGKRHEAWK